MYSDPLALLYSAQVYPCAGFDALSPTDVNLCDGDRGFDIAVSRPLGVGDLTSYGPIWPGKETLGTPGVVGVPKSVELSSGVGGKGIVGGGLAGGRIRGERYLRAPSSDA